MSTKPSLILTRLDVQRLERLIENLDESTPGVFALQEELDRAAQVVGHEEVPAGVVTMNSRVHCREEASGKDYHLTLVYPKDAGAEGKVSVLAPIGCALLGLSVGEQIDWPAPGGKTLKLKLLEVEYQPEAAGDFDL
ncbi:MULTISPECIES: nucleoside diphosphate kinase regulator [Pseudomonas]|uniref:nucleoside diphosphate kinase regulator n=1 Tax=Pseudomonas TaxID=286 RepID=UPI000D9BC095|nr:MULTISPECIES: nucleoside diphosphate kinase regulator [Pseudomonas]MBH3386537.1 nucleoside diphosphate kinase regulator [Pseudomonas juntendi]MBR7519586.1 nucleoside diphosphate kinase regulator [Pseudomonas juntendi]PYB99095.1 nucleoside diphosphate kinase regulator [Pseudomonas sp. MB-090624]WBM32677.1 nucleoside diphosphate kinase regulator [Pseudomonas sp. NY11382]